ncbi:hypothetical protein DLAC_05742 [Tieghemostelium lacteum]|uniref:Uncharacterized protein n=1 Tax=Tieghemostelium lacteum TaxID=361077 RepID=A0A151ZGR0_TIELA|nr:hypothetical protein DLAC_05742 [Tieghemostelium lacteum]|eukprot:KYQ93115.1 hypothetical protein DLAC_05742 [Tieghemostelium lacteum]
MFAQNSFHNHWAPMVLMAVRFECDASVFQHLPSLIWDHLFIVIDNRMKDFVEICINKHIGDMTLAKKIQIAVNFTEYSTFNPILRALLKDLDTKEMDENIISFFKMVLVKLKTHARRAVFHIFNQHYKVSQPYTAIRAMHHFLILDFIIHIDWELSIVNEFIEDMYIDIQKVYNLEILKFRCKFACILLKRLNLQERDYCTVIIYRLFICDPTSFLHLVVPVYFDKPIIDEILHYFKSQLHLDDNIYMLLTSITNSKEYYFFFFPILEEMLKMGDKLKNNMKCMIELFKSPHEYLKELQSDILKNSPPQLTSLIFLHCPTTTVEITTVNMKPILRFFTKISDTEKDYLVDNITTLDISIRMRYWKYCQDIVGSVIKDLSYNSTTYDIQITMYNTIQTLLEYNSLPNTLPYLVLLTELIRNVHVFTYENNIYHNVVCRFGLMKNYNSVHWKSQYNEYIQLLEYFINTLNNSLKSIGNCFESSKKEMYINHYKILSFYGQTNLVSIESVEVYHNTLLKRLANLIKITNILNEYYGFAIDSGDLSNYPIKERVDIQEQSICSANGINGKCFRDKVLLDRMIHFTLVEPSEFFKIVFQFYFEKEKELDKVMEFTTLYIKKLVDNDPSIALNDILGKISLFKEEIYQKELRIITKYFYPQFIKNLQLSIVGINDPKFYSEIDRNTWVNLLSFCTNHTLDDFSHFLVRVSDKIKKENTDLNIDKNIFDFSGESDLPMYISQICKQISLKSHVNVCNFIIDFESNPYDNWEKKLIPYSEPYDINSWIECEIQSNPNLETLKKVYNIKFYEHLNTISFNLFIEPSNIEEYQLDKNELLFYTNKSKRLKMAQTIFEYNESWVNQIIDQFIKHFGLNRALDTFLDPNQSSNSRGIMIQTKSYSVFNQYIETCYSLLFNYRSINTLKSIIPQSPEQQLVSKFIETISIPKNSKILKQFQLLLSDGYSILPLYDTISNLYQNYFIYTLDKLRNKSPKSIQEKFYEFINQSSIKGLNELLDNNHDYPGLNYHFRFDYLTRTMKIDKDLFEVINRLLLKLNNHKTNSVTQLFVSNYFFSNLVFFIISFIYPVINLKRDSAKLQYTVIKNQFIEDIENSILINFNDAKNLKKQLILNSFNALEFFIDEILSSEIVINDIVEWMNATREMFNRSSVQQTLLMISDFKDTKDNIEKHQKSIIKINTLHQIFLFISSKFQNQHFTPLIKSLKQIKYHDTLAELSILKVFQQLLQLNQLLPKESHDLFIPNQVLLDIVEPLALMKNETNLNELLKLCNGTDSITNDSASLPIPEGWYTSMISSQLQESREQVMKTSAEIFATNNISEFVSPLLSNNIIDSFLNLSLPQDYKSSQLANCLYHSVVEGYEDPKKNLTLLDIIFERSNLMEKFKKDPKNNLPMKINSIALETFLIEKFCEILTNDGLTSVILNDKVFTTLNSLFKVDESQRSSAEEYQNRSNQLLFINKIGDQQTLFNLLQDKKFLDSFSLGNLYMDHTLDFSHQFKLPFVHLESNIHYPFFMKVKTTLSATPLNMSELVNETETPILKGLFRSSLLILLFQDYNEEKPLKQYQSILTDEKLKTHFELEPVLRIYEKIINNSFGDNLLDNLLKKDANKNEFETSISHMVINFVAMSLGSNDKSYLFNLTRDLLKVAGNYFPACDAGHKFRDYGMKHNDKDFTSTMGGNIQKKHIVSSTSWLILAYAISVYPEYLEKFNDKQLDFSPQLENKTSTNELVSYVFNFGLSSIKEFKNNPENLHLHLEPCQFISEYIYDVWEHSYQLNENTSMKSFYCSENEALDYENQILIPIINKIYDEYPKRNELILQMIEKKSKQHAEYLKIRQELAKSFSSPIYSFRFIKDFITSNNDSKLKALVFFLNQVDMLSISEYIPNLINFLKLCSHHFQKYLSADQLNWNFPQIHKYLLDQKYDTLSLTKLENSWRELKKIWVLISNRIRDYIYPRSTPKINDETPIKSILPLSEANTGAILDIINEWIKIQSKTMRILDEIEDENLSESMKNVISSFDGSKCDIMDMDIENTENKFSLLGSNLTPNAFESFLKENISYYQTNYRDQFKPDLMEIQNKLMITVLSGKMYHSINSNSLSNLPFTKSEIDELTITIEDFSLPIDQELEKSIEISSDREGTNTSDNHNQDNIDDYTPIDAFYVNEENTEVIDAIYQPCSTIHITPLDNDVNGLRRSIYHWIRYCPEFNNLIFSQTGPLQKSIAKFQKEAQSTTHLYLNIQNLDNLLLECMELSNDQPIDKPIGLLVKLLDKISEIHPEALKYFTWTITSFCVICNTKCNHPDIYVPLDSFSGIDSDLEPVYLSTILNEKLLVGDHIKQPCGHKLTYEVESHPKYIFVPIDRIEEPSLHNILQPKKLARDFRIVLNETITSPQDLEDYSIKIHSVLYSEISRDKVVYSMLSKKNNNFISSSLQSGTNIINGLDFSPYENNCSLIILEVNSIEIDTLDIELQISKYSNTPDNFQPDTNIYSNINNDNSNNINNINSKNEALFQYDKAELQILYERGPKELVNFLGSKEVTDYISIFTMPISGWEKLVPEPTLRNMLYKLFELLKKSFLEHGIINERSLSDRISSSTKSKDQLQEIFNSGVILWVNSLNFNQKSKDELIDALNSFRLTDFFFLFNFTQWG